MAVNYRTKVLQNKQTPITLVLFLNGDVHNQIHFVDKQLNTRLVLSTQLNRILRHHFQKKFPHLIAKEHLLIMTVHNCKPNWPKSDSVKSKSRKTFDKVLVCYKSSSHPRKAPKVQGLEDFLQGCKTKLQGYDPCKTSAL